MGPARSVGQNRCGIARRISSEGWRSEESEKKVVTCVGKRGVEKKAVVQREWKSPGV